MQLDITIYAESIEDITPTKTNELAIDIINVDVKSLLDSFEASDLIDYIINRTEVYDELYQNIKEQIQDSEYAHAEDRYRG